MVYKPKPTKRPEIICDGARKAPMPTLVRAMLATLVDKPFSDPDWLFETKWDGVRAIGFLRGGKTRFISRSQKEMTPQFSELADITAAVNASEAILDGEIVALNQQGVSRFQLLQPRLGRKNAAEIQRMAARSRIAYYVFDLLYLDGFDLTGCRLLDRKERLRAILKPSKNVQYSDHIIGEGEKLYREIAKVPLEGMIAKELNSTYVQRRSTAWLKIKTVQETEVVVGGYTEPRHSRAYFGALVVGLYTEGRLHYVAHVGGGFNQKTLEQLYKLMQPLKIRRAPFVEEPQTNEAVHWLEPRLVAQVKFSEWTADRRLRQPIFLGLREDKQPEQCIFEPKRHTDQVVHKVRRPSRV